MSYSRVRGFFAAAVLALLPTTTRTVEAAPPNAIIINADDLGYGDLGCYGHPSIQTPNLDRMAAEGVQFFSFYSGSSVCTPSRTALLTGRYAPRSGMASMKRRVLFSYSEGGIPKSEVLISELLKDAGYATACIGKWHLGHLPQYLPTSNGFDEYFGIPYSNDMKPCPLLENEKEVENPVDQTTVTKRYTARALDFIKRSKDKPFFLYFAHTFPHTPLFASDEFKGKSGRGLYGDVVQELDWSVGQVLQTLQELKLAENTFVFFTSDNGPWLIRKLDGGSAGLLREGKGSTWEGGQRVPGIAWWPGKIKPGKAYAPACNMDLFATAAAVAGAAVPGDRAIDGVNLLPALLGQGENPRKLFVFYRDDELWAVRYGQWKLHYVTKSAYGTDPAVVHNPPQLFDVGKDPSEQFDVAKENPQVIEEIARAVEEHKATMKPVENQLERVSPDAPAPASKKKAKAKAS